MTERTDFFSQAWYTLARALVSGGLTVQLLEALRRWPDSS
jgi:hypothetical protein